MTSIKLAYMPQDSSSLITPYIPEHSMRGKSKGTFWGTPAAVAASSTSSAPASSSVWGSPLSVLNNNTNSSAAPVSSPFLQATHHQSLAALAANSEPIPSNDHTHTPNSMTSSSFAQPPSSSASSQFSSRQNSHSETPSPVSAAASVLGSPSGSTVPNTPTMSANKTDAQSSHATGSIPTLNEPTSSSEEIINTAIVVKNIPFAIKKEQLIDFMTQLGLPLPYAFNYHFDNGVFRGLAFANFATAEETAAVISSLNGRELGGRKLRVEYKKMLPYQERERIEREKRERRGQLEEQHQKIEVLPNNNQPTTATVPTTHAHQHVRSVNTSTMASGPLNSSLSQLSHLDQVPLLAARNQQRSSNNGANGTIFTGLGIGPSPVDMNDPETLETYSSLSLFKGDTTRTELIILAPQMSQISSNQMAILGTSCEKLDLVSGFNDEHNFVIAKKTDRVYFEEGDNYFSGLLRNAASPVSFGRAKGAVNSVHTAAMRPPSSASVHHPSFPTVASAAASSAAHTNGLQRWNSVGNVSGGNVGGAFAK